MNLKDMYDKAVKSASGAYDEHTWLSNFKQQAKTRGEINKSIIEDAEYIAVTRNKKDLVDYAKENTILKQDTEKNKFVCCFLLRQIRYALENGEE